MAHNYLDPDDAALLLLEVSTQMAAGSSSCEDSGIGCSADKISVSNNVETEREADALLIDDMEPNSIGAATTGGTTGDASMNKEVNQEDNSRTQQIKNLKRISQFSFENQKLRVQGRGYVGQSSEQNKKNVILVDKRPRRMKPLCSENSRCMQVNNKDISPAHQCFKISERDRESAFKAFWNLNTWAEKKTFIRGLADVKEPLRADPNATFKRQTAVKYHLKVENGAKVPVCCSNFSNTFGVSKRTIQSWLTRKPPKQKKGPRHQQKTQRQKTQDKVKKLKEILDSLPSVPGHYIRSKTDQRFLEPNWPSLRKMYRSWYKGIVKEPVCWQTFIKVIKQKKLKIFRWKKDRCNVCEKTRLEKEIPVEETHHFKEQKKAFEFKRSLKIELKHNKEEEIFCMDCEQVLPYPRLSVGASFFRLKLYLHNFTFYNMKSRFVDCFLFSEVDADGSANVFASCVSSYLRSLKEKNPLMRKVTMISDSCPAQNKNYSLSNVLLNFAIENNIEIVHFYMCVGHSHMEVDSFHSCVERACRGQDLYTIKDYMERISLARNEDDVAAHSQSVELHLLNYTDFKKSNNPYISNIRPGKKTGDPTVAEVRAFSYRPNGTIYFKLSVDDEFLPLPQKIVLNKVFESSPLFSKRQELSENKKKHINELLPYVPAKKRKYFDDVI